MKLQHHLFVPLSLIGIAAATTFSPVKPPAVPLAVRSPYLSTWLNAGTSTAGTLAGQWPVHWSNQVTGWAGMIRVDGTAYAWMGIPGPTAVTQSTVDYTSTTSTFIMDVGGKVEMNITFLSPITPNDLQRQSLVFSYLNVEVTSSDGASHDVQLYADISAEWVSGDDSATAQWSYGSNNGVAYHKVWKQTQEAFSEINDRTEYGNWYWATDDTNALTYQSGRDQDVRGAFVNNGKLGNTQDSNYRAISTNWPVFAYAIDLGTVGSAGASTLFSIGLCQEDAVQFDGASGYNPVPSLWTQYFGSDLAALEFFHNDYATASGLSSAFDAQVAQDSLAAGGQDYLTITSLAARQAFGATQLAGTEAKPYLFLKEISSDGNVNTVDVIFPAHPILVYANPTLLKYLLDPLFENQEAGNYPNQWSMHDLGSHYPNATGHTDGNDEAMPLEECGNMLIMTLAYALKANDAAYISQHYALLKQWTGFLVDEALYPNNQLSTDDFAGTLANQTNLAVKGIIGIEAMSVMANMVGNSNDSSLYHGIATDYINQWQTLGFALDANPPHSTLAYGQNDTHGLLYNIYAQVELGLSLIPQSVFDMQSAFYPTVENPSGYGVPLDTRHSYTKGDWECFAAAAASSSTRSMFISALAKWLANTPTNRALTDLYDTDDGSYPGITFVARPVIGGTFALLVSNLMGSS